MRGPAPATVGLASSATLRWLALGASLAWGGCHRRSPSAPAAPSVPAPLLLLPVELTEASPGKEHIPDAVLAVLRDEITTQIESAGLARRVSQDASVLPATGLRVRVLLGCERLVADGRAAERVAVEVKLDQRPGGDVDGLHADLLASGMAPDDDARAVLDAGGRAAADERCGRLASRTVKDRLGRYLAGWRLKFAPPQEIASALGADGGAVGRLEALRVIGERRLSALAPQVLSLLTDEDEETRDAALGAILALKDRRAVKVLTRDRALNDRHELRKILDAVATLGGRDAEEYLSFVSDTHDDPEIKRMAAQALVRLRRGDPNLDSNADAG